MLPLTPAEEGVWRQTDVSRLKERDELETPELSEWIDFYLNVWHRFAQNLCG